ncbi:MULTISPECIES: hypothetical protein [unclassified Bacillus cereus group]|uniref:hypothetical protein n=1 Tax=unclassified Bacillus cereus group TaxID=2750818 RepID=UPI0022E7ECA2|nr:MULTISPECIES: hypothetical protein [unclassified Bacillus cereus group]MDA2218765.1 hypothetical protein [Bacillus cereus group sp. Bc228]MDA2230164.1 hypothetical protein [Bacillus cereus group sp. Bc227]
MKEKLQCLQLIREGLDENTFRFVVAEVIVKHYVTEIAEKKKKFYLRDVHCRTNLMLRSMGLDEVSYRFVHKNSYVLF